MITMLIQLLVLAIVVIVVLYVVKLILGQLGLPEPVGTIVLLILGLIFLLIMLRIVGVPLPGF